MRKKSRWSEQRSGKRHGSLNRAVGSPAGRPIPARLAKRASNGKLGRATQRRANKARGGSR